MSIAPSANYGSRSEILQQAEINSTASPHMARVQRLSAWRALRFSELDWHLRSKPFMATQTPCWPAGPTQQLSGQIGVAPVVARPASLRELIGGASK